MGMHFRRKSNVSGAGSDEHKDVKLSKEDQARFKVRTASVNDPILDAVQEAQPFEQAADTFNDLNRQSYFSGMDGTVLRDVFGQPIHQVDVSNPTRARDERPLDTIRSFEYAVTGDPSWSQQLETATYGFNVRPDYPLANTAVAMGGYSQQQQQSVYQPQQRSDDMDDGKKKKKGGWFRRKKK